MGDGSRLPPRATYRLQLTRDFTFADAAAIAPYLAGLGISHAYLSPILAARSGSSHGYDVVDHHRLAADLGSMADFRAMVAAFRGLGLGLIVDIVPNHMGIGPENSRWMDVLRWGRAAANARFFDIDWDPPQPELAGKILLPVLDRPLDAILAAGEIRIGTGQGGLIATWHDQIWPITPDSLKAAEGSTLEAMAARLDQGPPTQLRQVLDRQYWRLAEWRRAAAEINYRRFFAINDLAAIRVEDRTVFEASHALILDLVEAGAIDGLRIDHIDGLADPKTYLDRLARAIRDRGRVPYLVVEKILAEGEMLPPSWPVAGTTGYDRLAALDQVFCDGTGAEFLVERYRSATRRQDSPRAQVKTAKRRFLETDYVGEIDRLARRAHRLAAAHATLRDRPIAAFGRALREIIVHLPVYRCYVDENGSEAADRWWLDAAFAAADVEDRDLGDFLRAVLSVSADAQSGDDRAAMLQLAQSFQQISGPAMAKGLEDTVFYDYVPLLGLNEVGGSAEAGPLGAETFHALNRAKLHSRPDELIAGSTHDTKRGEDARARLLCLTSTATNYQASLARWRRLAKNSLAIGINEQYYLFQTMLGAWPPGLRSDDSAGLAGFAARLKPAMLKAAREAKKRTNWLEPDLAYEALLGDTVDALLDPTRSSLFLADFAATADRIGFWGALTSLSALLLRLTTPGIPDLYQGSEGWALSLVDPDNRRSVDFAAAAARPDQPLPGIGAFASSWHDGAVKTGLIRRVLALRRRLPQLFARGPYRPLRAIGQRADCLIAFARAEQGDRCIVLAPRFWPRLWPSSAARPDWRETWLTLPAGSYRDCLTGAPVRLEDETARPVADLLPGFPCAVLVCDG